MNKKYDYGIVIGRFQPFHLAHRELIKHALNLADKIVIVFGSARSAPDVKNPFTPEMREEMVRFCFPEDAPRLIFRAVRDYPYNDNFWITEIQNIVAQAVEDSESDNSQIPAEFKKYENFERGSERLIAVSKKDFPVYKTRQEKDRLIRPLKEQTSADRIKLLTDEITEVIAEDAQNNVLLIQQFVNENWRNNNAPKLLEPTVSNGQINFRTTDGKTLVLSLKEKNSKPDKAEFEDSIRQLLEPSAEQTKKNPQIALVGFFKDRSSYYLNLFPQWHFEELFINPKDHPEFAASGERIREQYFSENDAWTKQVPPEIAAYLERFKETEYFPALKREFQYLQKYRSDTRFVGVPFEPVFITTDAVVVQSGHVLVIRRGHQPGKGLLALPGGFLHKDLTLEDSALRELKDETRINVPGAVLKGSIKAKKEFDFPDRSQRGRTVTFAYFIELEASLQDGLPRVKGGDDAAKAFWLPLSALGEMEDKFFEDHYFVIRHFLGF